MIDQDFLFHSFFTIFENFPDFCAINFFIVHFLTVFYFCTFLTFSHLFDFGFIWLWIFIVNENVCFLFFSFIPLN